MKRKGVVFNKKKIKRGLKLSGLSRKDFNRDFQNAVERLPEYSGNWRYNAQWIGES